MLTVTNLRKTYQKHDVVQDVSFHLQQGHCTALIGPNGAGKTTIMRMLTGLIKPSGGAIHYTNPAEDYRYLIGYLPQYPSFYNWMTGEEFLTYCSKLYGLSKEESKERTASLLKKVSLVDAKNKRIRTYSGGMKQRLGIAQALIHDPAILLLDEPGSSLDPIGRRDILTLMEQLKENMTILFSTHILNDAEEISDSVIVLKDGNIVEKGTMEQLQTKYATAKVVLKFANKHDELLDSLGSLPTVSTVEIVGDFIHVYASDVSLAQKELLTFILEHDLQLKEFRIGRVSMEEMFLEAVH